MLHPALPVRRPRSAVFRHLSAFCCLLLSLAVATRAATQAYTLTITTPTASASVPLGSPVTVSAAVTGNAHPLAKIDFYDLLAGKLLGTATAAPYAIAWTPAATGKAFLRVTGTDTTGVTANSAITTVNIVAAPAAPPPVTPPPAPPPATTTAALTIPPTTLPAAQATVAYSQTLTATGGTAPYTWTLAAGGLPTGLTLSSAGVIGGTVPAGSSWISSYPFQAYVAVTDAANAKAYVSLTLNVLAPDGSGGTPTPTPTPTPSTYTVTVTNGTANGAASASVAPGATVTLVAAPAPAGQYFKQWSGTVAVADSFAPTTTFAMPSAAATFTASYYTPPALPATVAGHPRLWINQADLPRLRSWAVPSNAVYQQGLRAMLNLALQVHQKCFPNGQPASPYPDLGDIDGYSGANVTSNMCSEQHALTLAFFGLIDPVAANRLSYAQKARDLFMYLINAANGPHQKGTAFRDPIFSIYNRSNTSGHSWPLLADWLQGVTDANGQPVAILSAQDKAAIRTVFMMWAEDCLNASTTGGDHPNPVGVVNNPALLPGGRAARIAANNYYLGHARLITMMPLALDPADDPPLTPGVPDAVRGNTLRSYLVHATGAWLYQQFAMFGDPADVRAAFNLPATASVGLASGGTAAEGGLYGHSIGYILAQLLSLQSAGFTDATFCGPQLSLLGSPVWDRYVHGYLSTLVPQQQVDPSQAYLGPVYKIANFGDVLRIWATPDNMVPFALLALTELKQGRTDHLAAARWIALNAVEGGAAGLLNRIQRPYDTHESILYFLLFDPTDPAALAPADPRPAYPVTYFDPGMGRLLSRTDWSPSATLLDFRAGWLSINHQDPDGGQIQLYRKGEWLTKELSNYDNNGNGQSSQWHNTLTLQNWCANGTPHLNYFEAPYWPTGSQWNNGLAAGDPVTTASSGSGYAFAQSLLTNLYNRPVIWTPADNAADIQHASRSLVSLPGDVVVVYDRATSLHNGFKRFNLNTAVPPVLDQINRTARVSTPRGQKLFLQTLQPATAMLSYVPEAGTLTNIAQLETMTGRIVVEDPARPADVRFLHVLNGADGTATAPVAAAVVASTAGTSYTGAVIGGSTAVLFPVTLTTSSPGTTYSVAASVVHHVVTGLTPGAGYTITSDNDGTTAQVVLTAGGPATADSAGVLAFDLP